MNILINILVNSKENKFNWTRKEYETNYKFLKKDTSNYLTKMSIKQDIRIRIFEDIIVELTPKKAQDDKIFTDKLFFYSLFFAIIIDNFKTFENIEEAISVISINIISTKSLYNNKHLFYYYLKLYISFVTKEKKFDKSFQIQKILYIISNICESEIIEKDNAEEDFLFNKITIHFLALICPLINLNSEGKFSEVLKTNAAYENSNTLGDEQDENIFELLSRIIKNVMQNLAFLDDNIDKYKIYLEDNNQSFENSKEDNIYYKSFLEIIIDFQTICNSIIKDIPTANLFWMSVKYWNEEEQKENSTKPKLFELFIYSFLYKVQNDQNLFLLFMASFLNYISQGELIVTGQINQTEIKSFHKFFSKLSNRIIEEEVLFNNFVKIFYERLINQITYYVGNDDLNPKGNFESISDEIQNLNLYPSEIYLNILVKVIVKYGENFKKLKNKKSKIILLKKFSQFLEIFQSDHSTENTNFITSSNESTDGNPTTAIGNMIYTNSPKKKRQKKFNITSMEIISLIKNYFLYTQTIKKENEESSSVTTSLNFCCDFLEIIFQNFRIENSTEEKFRIFIICSLLHYMAMFILNSSEKEFFIEEILRCIKIIFLFSNKFSNQNFEDSFIIFSLLSKYTTVFFEENSSLKYYYLFYIYVISLFILIMNKQNFSLQIPIEEFTSSILKNFISLNTVFTKNFCQFKIDEILPKNHTKETFINMYSSISKYLKENLENLCLASNDKSLLKDKDNINHFHKILFGKNSKFFSFYESQKREFNFTKINSEIDKQINFWYQISSNANLNEDIMNESFKLDLNDLAFELNLPAEYLNDVDNERGKDEMSCALNPNKTENHTKYSGINQNISHLISDKNEGIINIKI